MSKKKFPPDTGNTLESLYAGFEQPQKKQPKFPIKPIKSVDDVPPKSKKQKRAGQ